MIVDFARIDGYRKERVYGKVLKSSGCNGVFSIPHKGNMIRVIASDGKATGWEHVSVSVSTAVKTRNRRSSRLPTWIEMCFVKDLFWEEHEVVMQLHPAKDNYVNNHPHVLHMWRPTSDNIPLPPVEMVGIPGVELDINNPNHAAMARDVFLRMHGGGL